MRRVNSLFLNLEKRLPRMLKKYLFLAEKIDFKLRKSSTVDAKVLK